MTLEQTHDDGSKKIYEYTKMAYGYGLSESVSEGLINYIVYHIETGGFLRRFLENDLMGALGKADEDNKKMIFNIGMFLYNVAPMNCLGSPSRVREWLEAKK